MTKQYDIDYIPPNLYHADDNLDNDFLPITHDEIADLSDDLPLPVDPDQGADPATGDNINNTAILADASHPNYGENEGTFGTNTGIEPNGIINNEDDEGANEPDVEEDDEVANNDNEDSPPEQEATTRSAYNLRPRHERNQGPSFIQAVDDPHSNQSYFPPVQLMQQSALNNDCGHSLDPTRRIIFAHVMTQMSERVVGLEKHGQIAEEALLKEFKQLENLSVFEPLMADNLHAEERKGALRALNLLKEKRDGSIKGDNESAIKLEKNGWASAGKKSRHTDIRFFFIKDRVASNNIKVRHCPTKKMVADFFTKPLQGELFRKLRGVIMGHQPMEHLIKVECPRSVLERFGQ